MDAAQFINLGGLTGLIAYVIWQDYRSGKLTRGRSQLQEINADNRNALQPLLSQMEILSQHFNHETTDLLTEIKLKTENNCKKLDSISTALDDIRYNGIRIKQ